MDNWPGDRVLGDGAREEGREQTETQQYIILCINWEDKYSSSSGDRARSNEEAASVGGRI